MSSSKLKVVCSIVGRQLLFKSAPKSPFGIGNLFQQQIRYEMSTQKVDMFSLIIDHDPKIKKFFIIFENDEMAELDYAVIRPRVLDLYHTGVPEKFQGQGIAQRLAAEAFQYVVQRDYSMKLSCPFLKKYLEKNPNPKYSSRVVDG